jgi:adenylate kinase
MRLLMVGPPGAGKGTQAWRLARHFGVEHVASGDLLRREVAAATPLGRQVAGYLEGGDLVPDDLMLDVIGPKLQGGGGLVLDGFPRNLVQAEAAEGRGWLRSGDLDAAIYLKVRPEELLRRLLQRASEQVRNDDREPTIRHRLSLFDEETKPLIDCYRNRNILVTVNGEQDVDDVTRSILQELHQVTKAGSDAAR